MYILYFTTKTFMFLICAIFKQYYSENQNRKYLIMSKRKIHTKKRNDCKYNLLFDKNVTKI